MQDLLQLAAERTHLYLSPHGQPHAVLPSGAATPLYSEDYFTFLYQLSEQQQTPLPDNFKLAELLRVFDARAHSSKRTRPVPLRTSYSGPKTLLIDLQENFEAVELTRKRWQITANFDTNFLRPALNYALPTPEPPQYDLPEYLTQLFDINATQAAHLADWLACALLPDGKPPILVITGEAADEAASKLRNLIDPVPQALMPLPANTNQLGQLALTHRVLAFAVYGQLTEKRKAALNAVLKGMPLQVKESNHRRGKLFGSVSRPVIIASETGQQISRNQITLEINKANLGDHAQILGALLDLASAALNTPLQTQIEIIWETKQLESPAPTTQSDPPVP